VRYGTTPRQVEGVLLRRANAPGTRQLRAVLHGDVKVTYGDVLERPELMLAERKALIASTEGALPDAPSVVAVPRTKS
jgi:hypothetical protein